MSREQHDNQQQQEDNNAQRSCLQNELFESFVSRFVDETKPDPLIQRQMESWSMTWKDTTTTTKTTFPPSVKFQPTSVVEGTLEWIGGGGGDKNDESSASASYSAMIADLECVCCWQEKEKEEEEGDQKTAASGSLYFSLHGSVRFPTAASIKRNNSTEMKKVDRKIRSKMIQRLRNDSYIRRLLLDEKEDKDDNNIEHNDNNKVLLCEAMIHQQVKPPGDEGKQQEQKEQLEERVYINNDPIEGLRRSVFSHSDTVLDMIEILVGMPFLPCPVHNKNNESPSLITTTLADRAKLRLLEDAMYDACEEQGEEECIQDLTISSEQQDNDGDGDDTGTDPRKKNALGKNNKNISKKRRKQS